LPGGPPPETAPAGLLAEDTASPVKNEAIGAHRVSPRCLAAKDRLDPTDRELEMNKQWTKTATMVAALGCVGVMTVGGAAVAASAAPTGPAVTQDDPNPGDGTSTGTDAGSTDPTDNGADPTDNGADGAGDATGVPDGAGSDVGTPDDGTADPDAPPAPGSSDSDAPDAGAPDGGATDGGAPDAGVPDGGAADAGAPDGGVNQAGATEGGAPHAGAPFDTVPGAGPLQ
jgi:hypothetical protein